MMTIEEKAKAYDEALSRAKASYGTGAYDDATTEFIFPELSESEDERIRKILIDAFEKKNNSFIDELVDCRLTKADILEWLEKQKEQKPNVIIPKFRIGDTICLKGSMAEYTIESIDAEYYHGKGWGLPISAENNYELVEQKTVWSEEDENFIKELCNLLASIAKNNYVGCYYAPDLVSKLRSLRPQSKQEWSDEDEDYYDTIVRKLQVIGEDSGLTMNQIQFLSEHNPCDFEVEIEKAYKNADKVQYRKGFKDGVDSVKSSEWSEEDDVMVEDIIDAIPTNYAASDYKEMVSWLRLKLKYLRPAPHIKSVDYEMGFLAGQGSVNKWKPTKQQMEALKDAMKEFHACKEKEALKELYDNLLEL